MLYFVHKSRSVQQPCSWDCCNKFTTYTDTNYVTHHIYLCNVAHRLENLFPCSMRTNLGRQECTLKGNGLTCIETKNLI
jgi:hypothetical protein